MLGSEPGDHMGSANVRCLPRIHGVHHHQAPTQNSWAFGKEKVSRDPHVKDPCIDYRRLAEMGQEIHFGVWQLLEFFYVFWSVALWKLLSTKANARVKLLIYWRLAIWLPSNHWMLKAWDPCFHGAYCSMDSGYRHSAPGWRSRTRGSSLISFSCSSWLGYADQGGSHEGRWKTLGSCCRPHVLNSLESPKFQIPFPLFFWYQNWILFCKQTKHWSSLIYVLPWHGFTTLLYGWSPENDCISRKFFAWFDMM